MAGQRSYPVIRAGLETLYFSGAHMLLKPLFGGVGVILTLHHVRPPRLDGFQPNRLLEIEPAFLESSGSGIQVKSGDQSIILLNTRARNARDVNYLASGNAMRARYVDTETGYVTINNVYAQ